MKVKKGDILYYCNIDEMEDICISVENTSIKRDRLFTEIIYLSDKYIKQKKGKYIWRSKATNRYCTVLAGEGIKEYIFLGNYFKLRNKRKIIKGLMSEDSNTRNFFVDYLKFKNEKTKKIKKKSV